MIKKIAQKLFALACLVLGSAFPVGAMPYSDHLQASKDRISERMGVEFSALELLYRTLESDFSQASKMDAEYASWDPFLFTTTSRSEWVRHLSAQGRSALDEDLFRQIFEWRIALNQAVPVTQEVHRTLALLALVEDLIREQRLQTGLPASWYDRQRGFLNASHHHDFEYQDGDILIVVGRSSISALITQSTFPQRKFSHALILRMRDNELRTMEALIETGSVSRSEKVFNNLGLNAVQVLRWKDPEMRAQRAAEASDRAFSFVERRLPYDSAIDLNDPKRLFCSEFVARAYTDGTDVSIHRFIPQMAMVRSAPVLAYLGNLGVQNPLLVSPGDFSASPWLDVVAEYRRSDSLVQLWEIMILADVFIERLELGYELSPDLWRNLLSMGVAVGDLVLGIPRTILGVDLALLPESLNRRALAYMITQEKVLFKKARAQARRTMRASDSNHLLELKPWELRAAQSFAIQENRSLRRILFKR